ncbi:uncharacterized protein LOC127838899 [Dreissena polymorpha]|uniref:Uncharacterized protein n=1 Tax=Dreissena polymorpha TaxID=45954 RepID=A0A9D4FCX3_DREPO|nr:uncharacterized protein LOC127838899 [Dreissena polymorpha]KAH3795987.1 hypothetical protein DPMN_149551 [Dreissena polymorpha]
MRRKSGSVANTAVVKLGMAFFVTDDCPYQETVETYNRCVDMDEEKTRKNRKEKKDGKFFKFVKKHFLQRKGSSNDVKEIHLVPEGEELKWASRSAGSAQSRSSSDTTGSEGDKMKVVHDMAEEYIQEDV